MQPSPFDLPPVALAETQTPEDKLRQAYETTMDQLMSRSEYSAAYIEKIVPDENGSRGSRILVGEPVEVDWIWNDARMMLAVPVYTNSGLIVVYGDADDPQDLGMSRYLKSVTREGVSDEAWRTTFYKLQQSGNKIEDLDKKHGSRGAIRTPSSQVTFMCVDPKQFARELNVKAAEAYKRASQEPLDYGEFL